MLAAQVLEAVKHRDVGVIERGEHFRLALEPGMYLRVVPEPVRQELQRHITLQPRVRRAVHNAHPALAKGMAISYGPRRVLFE